ncbi:MAG: hypothetical protein ACLPIC_18250 [Rhodoblastus sp.]|uniref:hypothetical protein n=1 Tax=Rhodoblastus sp. TaxID=1962975 RepID=UPI003F987E9A
MLSLSRRVLARCLTAFVTLAPAHLSQADESTSKVTAVRRTKSGCYPECQLMPSGGDDTNAIDAALKLAGAGAPLRLGPGRFFYNGGAAPNFEGSGFEISGAGPALTTIELGVDSYFIQTAHPIATCGLKGIAFHGGRGAFRSNYSGVNVSYKKIFSDNIFVDYSECAIQNNGTDEPYWIIDNNVFMANNSTVTMGVALSRFCDNSIITRNSFLTNRIHIKLRSAGVSTMVHDNDFLYFEHGRSDFPRSSIWLVLHDDWVNAGGGFVATHNKFGNENQVPADIRVLFASEAPVVAQTNGTVMPELSPAAEGYADGHIFSHNKISGGHRIPFIWSTTANLRNQKVVANNFDGTPPSEIIGFAVPPPPEPFNQSNLIGFNNFAADAVDSPAPIASASHGVASIEDPFGIFEANPNNFHSFPGGGDLTGFQCVLDSDNERFSDSAGRLLRGKGGKDALGGRNAIFMEIAADRQICVTKIAPQIRVGEPTWIEFDISPYDGDSAEFVNVEIISEQRSVHWRRVVNVPMSGWRRFRFPFAFRCLPKVLTVVVSRREPGNGGFGVGRVKIYHSREPVNSAGLLMASNDFSHLPTSPEGLSRGKVWVDENANNVLRRV